MTLRKISQWFTVLLAIALSAAKASAYVMVTLQASGYTSSSFTAAAFTTGTGADVGTFTVSRSGTLSAVTVNLSLSGTAVSGVDYVAFPTNITLAANVTSSNLTVKLKSGVTITTPKTVVLNVLTNTAYFMGLDTNAVITLIPTTDITNSVASPKGRYWRGTGNDPTYWSQVIPLDYETGTVYSNMNGNASSLYGITSWIGNTLYHFDATNTLSQTNIANRIPFNNPIVAFGERVGGTPLYLNQPYSFGVYAGVPVYPGPDMVIAVLNRTNISLAGYIVLYPPSSTTPPWTNYVVNGFQVTKSTNFLSDGVTVTTNTFGLATTISTSPSMTWGSSSGTGFVLTHTASNQATNYYYVVQATGYANGSNPMTIDSSKALNYSFLYSLEFETRPPWRSVFLDQPHFDGNPLPPFYAGKTVAEMLTNTPPVNNVVNFTPAAATNLDDSPELRRHPVLDNFVASLNNDPIALANYVINQIDLIDPMDFSDNGNVQEQAINPSGVSRGALGTFLEKQGSPVEECALLVYLLRQAGVPAVYEFAPRNGVQILDARLSHMLKFQVHGGFNEAGQVYTTNTMIPVNYPWVAAYIGTNWVHIFPWMKDYQMTEGLNLWDEMPTNYANAYLWLHDYLYNTTNMTSLAVGGDETPRVIFPKFVQQQLLTSHPGVSLDDIGMQTINRPHNFARWQDFPTPTWVTNISTPLESLASPAITNISPTLTNIFDTLSVEIYSVTNPAEDIQSGDMRLCDLHDREFYINQFVTNSSVQLNLILMPFRPGITNQSAFSNDTNLLSKEVLSLTLAATDDALGIRFHYHRHRALSTAYATDPFSAFLGLESSDTADFERPLRKGEEAAICMDYGRVTHDMLNVRAADLWQMENTLRTNSAFTNSVSPDVYQGATMYLAGLSYYEKCDEFNQQNQNLHKIVNLSTWAAGLSKIEPARNGSGGLLNGKIDPVLPAVDMFNYQIAWTGNGTSRADSGQDTEAAGQNYNLVAIADGSAEEHQVINRFYQQTNAVSTVRLLQLAQSKGLGIVQLNVSNYVSQATATYQGHALNSYDPLIWQETTNIFQGFSGAFAFAYMTPGPITNANYKGMAALILGWGQQGALISPSSLNGAFGQDFNFSTIAPVNLNNWNLSDFNDNLSLTLNQPITGSSLLPSGYTSADYSALPLLVANGTYILNNNNLEWSQNTVSLYDLSSGTQNQTFNTSFQYTQQNGDLGQPNNTLYSRTSDPVSPITGEFYDDETDLQLSGPLPLALTRHYSSENLADNQFGAGWKLNIMPFLVVGNGSTNIFAAELDGSVYAYVRTATNADVWLPTLAANPQMNNDSGGIGSLANRLRNQIVQSVNGSTTNYTLYGSDGSVRAFQVTTFNNGILNQTRPYLQQWTDNLGNFYTFTYGTDPTQPNFGLVTKAQCSNGNFLGFDYDIYSHIIDAYTGDGRWLYYDYDEYGDLITVTLPDNTTRSYQYKLGTQAVTNGTAFYSTHLIIEEDKPDGRALINAYDSQRRVTNQLSTIGADLNPIRMATLIYSNNFNITNSSTTLTSGFTYAIDGNGHTNRYDYTNNLITKITDPLGQTIQQVWYADNATAPGYPRSLATRTDKRGMVMQYQYDANGNVTNTISTGDLTGDGITSQTATNTAVYNSNSLPVQITDPAGNSTGYVYDPTFNFLPQQVIRFAGANPVSTNFSIYGNVTNVVVNGNTTQTNMAFGLMTRQIRAYRSVDAATNDLAYDGHGFLNQSTYYSGTGDPNVATTYFYNERGQMVDMVDSLGADTFMDYDALNRPIEKDSYDEFGSLLSSSFNYYNDNGELNWVDGPRYNPEDYIFYDYDGAGRVTTEIHWLSEAGNDGRSVQAPSGYSQFAQTFYQYDPLGNLTLKVDPEGAMTTSTYDSLNRLVQIKHIDIDGLTILGTEGYGYEPGGQVHYATNGLGGITTKLYTIAGRPEFQSNPDGSTNAWRYYLDGRVKREVQLNGAYWQTTYDDFNRIITRIFYSAVGAPEATNSTQLDRRGNVIQKIDAGGNVFTTAYDGLDRAKVVAGPAIVTVVGSASGDLPNGPITYVTNVLQHVGTNFYDAAGRVLTNLNALGEISVSKMDAIGRPVSKQLYSASGALVHETYMAYSADHNSVTTTNGSGANAVITTTFTDTENHPVLILQYTSPSVIEETFESYDLSGNHIYEELDSFPFRTNDWHGMAATFDGLNRVINKYTRDNAYTTYAYDQMGNLTNRSMPEGLQWQATYNNAGEMLHEKYVGGTSATRTNTYAYFAGGNTFTGLLQTKTDGRGVSCTYAYDDWLRQTNMTYAGSLPEQNLTTTWTYEPRGFVTGITEQFASTNTGPATTIQRSFDPYGQLASESVNGGAFSYGTSQTWDANGRRAMLNIGGVTYGFSWQADGALTSASDSTGGGSYAYDTAGILTNRIVGNRQTSITSRDGQGRPLTIATTVNTLSQMTESLSWGGDGLITADTLARADFTDSRSYSYGYLSRRLAQEQLNLNGSTSWTNTLVYDNGVGAELGSLTQMGQTTGTSNKWSGVADAFSRVSTETNSTIQFAAYGHVNGQSTVSAWLDNQPVPATGVGTNAMRWQAMMELTPGTHRLTVAAAHPSGFYTAWATNSFTNNIAYQTTADSFDAAGNITQRIWRNASGTTNRTQMLSWDARGRLHSVTNRDAGNSGYNWTATYDALSRRISTTSVVVSNGVAFTSLPTTINSYFDPQVEFLELGVSYGTTTEWKLYGPGANGRYGGLNGTSGLEGVSPYLNLFYPTVSDLRGNILGIVTNGVLSWNPARPTGYGAVPGYRPVPLANGANISLSSAWRGRWVDITGYYNIGMRPYDPISGRWLTYDSVWNEADMNCYSFAGGDPINGFDADGRSAEAVREDIALSVDSLYNFALLTLARPSEGATPQGDQSFLNAFGSPMKNWFGVYYPSSSDANSLATTFSPLTQNAINSVGIGETTASTPDVMPMNVPETASGARLNPIVYGNTLTLTSPDVASQAASWQGSGNYPGVDNWVNKTLQPGEVVLSGAPGQSPFFMNANALTKSGGDQATLWQGVQVAPSQQYGYRPGVTAYMVTAPTVVGASQALENPQNGVGGYDQYFFENRENIVPIVSIPLTRP